MENIPIMGQIVAVASLITSLTVIAGVILGAYKFYRQGKEQGRAIQQIQEENALQCYCILACLRGLAEKGCNGPVHDGINRMEKYLNKQAHGEEHL